MDEFRISSIVEERPTTPAGQNALDTSAIICNLQFLFFFTRVPFQLLLPCIFVRIRFRRSFTTFSFSQVKSHKDATIRKTATMFSWSNNNNNSSKSRTKSTYPGRRSQQSRAAVGSVRAPSSISRAQHLTSYIEDPTLKRSTRRVSSGTFSTWDRFV